MKAIAGNKCSFKSDWFFLRVEAMFSERVLTTSRADYLVASSKSLFFMIYEITKMSFGIDELQISPCN